MHRLIITAALLALSNSSHGEVAVSLSPVQEEEERHISEVKGEEIEDLRQAKERAMNSELETDSVARLAEDVFKESVACLMSKMDILYDNRTGLSKEIQFSPTNFNCGKAFDIFRIVEQVKAHRNITTELPKCVESLLEGTSTCAPVSTKQAETTPSGLTTTSSAPGVASTRAAATPKAKVFKKPMMQEGISKQPVTQTSNKPEHMQVKPVARPEQNQPQQNSSQHKNPGFGQKGAPQQILNQVGSQLPSLRGNITSGDASVMKQTSFSKSKTEKLSDETLQGKNVLAPISGAGKTQRTPLNLQRMQEVQKE